MNQNRQLTITEMADLNGGGDVYTTECNWLNEACIKVSEDGKTAKTGKCVPASYNPAILVCDTGL